MPIITPSSFRHLASSNEPPSAEEIDLAVHWRQHIRAAQIAIPHPQTLAMKARIHRLVLAQKRIQAILSPIRRLPVEILQEIFSWVPIDSNGGYGYNVFDMKSGPWGVAQVCRIWRIASQSHSSFWAVPLLISTARARKLRNPEALLTCALSRTRSRNFDFELDCSVDYTHRESALLMSRTLLACLLAHSAQWCCALFTQLPEPLVANLSYVRGHVSELRRLVLDVEDMPHPRQNPWVSCIGFELCPSLRTARIRNISPLHFYMAPRLHTFINETEYVGLPFSDDSAELLIRQPQLDTLSTHYTFQRDPDTSISLGERMSDITHRGLRNLSTSDIILIDRLILPNLKRLSTFPMVCLDGDLFGISLFNLVLRSRFSLTSLHIGGCNAHALLLAIIEQLPQLEELSVGMYECHDHRHSSYGEAMHEIVCALGEVVGDKHVLAPKLQKLWYIDCHSKRFYAGNATFFEDLLSMVESRQTMTLLSLSIDCTPPDVGRALYGFYRTSRDRLMRLKDWGLCLKISDISQSGTAQFFA